MRSRYSSTSHFSYSFGPGPLTPAIKLIVYANVAMFVAALISPALTLLLGLRPADVLGELRVWQPVTYMFLHGGIFHILFNMLALWMFGVELERMWGSEYFTKYYFVSGVGAALTTMVLSFTPFAFADTLYTSLTIGASGAVYGVLLAYALYFPNRPIYMYLLFPIPAKYFVMIIGAISLYSSMGDAGGVAHTTHLGGLVAGYLYLKRGRFNLLAELRYRYVKWKIGRQRRRFDIYPGGRKDDYTNPRRDDVNRRIH
jgi:membrane associated rhomboid family serine protease